MLAAMMTVSTALAADSARAELYPVAVYFTQSRTFDNPISFAEHIMHSGTRIPFFIAYARPSADIYVSETRERGVFEVGCKNANRTFRDIEIPSEYWSYGRSRRVPKQLIARQLVAVLSERIARDDLRSVCRVE